MLLRPPLLQTLSDAHRQSGCHFRGVTRVPLVPSTRRAVSPTDSRPQPLLSTRKGISANQMKRTLGVSYKTAWYLCHRIRSAMGSLAEELLSGIVEVDETYVGGKKRGSGRGYRGNKTMVLGAIERGGETPSKFGSR